MAIKIRTKKLAKGMVSVYLDLHHKNIRWSEFPGLRYKEHPQTEAEKRDKKAKLELAAEIKSKRELEIVRGEYLIEERFKTERDFVEFTNEYIKQHEHLIDIRMFRSALHKLVEFKGKKRIPCFELTEGVLKQFASYLKQNLNGATPNNYFKKLKRVFRVATEEKLFRADPTQNVVIVSRPHHTKSVLTFDEMKLLAGTACRNDNVKRAFLFSYLTGLRYCDVVNVKWANINSNILNLKQQKTKVNLTVTLNEDTLSLLGKRNSPEQLIFKLPSHTGCLKWLRIWCKDAHIEKRITWHCARHSFATNLVESGVDVSITSKLLGHTSLANTNTYVRVSDAVKEAAINKLPSIF